MRAGYRKKIMRDTLIGGIMGGVAVTAFSYYTGYNAGEYICELVGLSNAYARGAVDSTIMSQLSLYGLPGGLMIGAGLGAAVSAAARCGRFSKQVLEDMLKEEDLTIEKK